MKTTEKVNHPFHYNQGDIECIDAMVAAFGVEAVRDFCKINAFKYLWRAGDKEGNSESQDLEKAVWYINKAKELSESIPGVCDNQKDYIYLDTAESSSRLETVRSMLCK